MGLYEWIQGAYPDIFRAYQMEVIRIWETVDLPIDKDAKPLGWRDLTTFIRMQYPDQWPEIEERWEAVNNVLTNVDADADDVDVSKYWKWEN